MIPLDTEVAGEYANSYVDIDEAIDILDNIGLPDLPWADADEGMQGYSLMLSAALIGMLPLRGSRVNPVATDLVVEQSLDFPRDCQSDTDIIPDNVKEAQTILAATVIYQNLTNLLAQFSESGGEGYLLENLIQSGAIESITVGGVFSVKLASASTTTIGITRPLGALSSIPTIFGFPVYMRLKPYLTQIRGGVIGD